MSERTIEYVPLDQVQEADTNPKNHNEAGLDASIDEFGYVDPIVIDGRTGKMVSGHGRMESLRRRRDTGGAPPDGIVVVNDTDWLVPVVRGWSSENDDQAAAFLIAANRLVEAGGWNDPELLAMLDGMQIELLDVTGFDTADLDDLRYRLLGTVGEEHRGMSPGERAEEYAAAGIKSIILPFPADRCDEVAKMMGRLRSLYVLDSNSALVEKLVEEALVDIGYADD